MATTAPSGPACPMFASSAAKYMQRVEDELTPPQYTQFLNAISEIMRAGPRTTSLGTPSPHILQFEMLQEKLHPILSGKPELLDGLKNLAPSEDEGKRKEMREQFEKDPNAIKAMGFIERVKGRVDEETNKQFLASFWENVDLTAGKDVVIKNIHERMVILFKDEPDLLEEFEALYMPKLADVGDDEAEGEKEDYVRKDDTKVVG